MTRSSATRRRWRASTALLALLVTLPLGARAEEPAAAAGCVPDPALTGTVAAVSGGRSFTLADGREVLLAAIETPAATRSAAGETDAHAAAAQAATAALAALVSARDVALSRIAAGTDRYGRLLARAFVVRDGAQRSVEAELLARGQAFVAPRKADPACTALLLAAERAARAAKLGLWADPYYEAKPAETPAAVLAALGRFAIVEGKVVSVRESGGTVYVNFGRRWTEDFTVTILKRNVRLFTAAGIEPKTLAGRRVRVRGWIEERGGPWIEATRPEQIEIADGR